ncbi:MAG: glycosyltransferase [Bacteroidales bacterium]|nr:glycosyltransferase [Bacteroidales bacterium]
MDTPLVNICTITYNHENYIGEALDSFLMQETDFPFNVLINEDCSTDNTADIIREYEKKYPNIIKPIYQKENQYSKGVDVTVVFNFSRAKGKYIALCEGDDYWTDKNKLQIQIEAMTENTKCNMSFHPSKILSENINIDRTMAQHSHKNVVFPPSEMIKNDGRFCPTMSIVFRRKLIDHLPDFLHSAIAGDYFFHVLASMGGGALFINRTMSVYRINVPDSWSNRMQQDNAYRQIVFYNYIESLNNLNNYLEKKYEKEIYYRLQNHYYNDMMFYLKNKTYTEFQRLGTEYLENYTYNINYMKLVLFVGLSTKSLFMIQIIKIIEEIFFDRGLLYRQILRKILMVKNSLKNYISNSLKR